MAPKSRPQPRNCLYAKCGKEFTPHPKYPERKYCQNKCRRAAWEERNFVDVRKWAESAHEEGRRFLESQVKPEDVERAKKFIDSQIPTKTTTELDAIFAKRPTLNYMEGPASALLPTEEEVDLRSLKYKVPKPPRKKRPSDFLKRIGFTPAELGTIMSWAKEFNMHNHAAEILRKVSR